MSLGWLLLRALCLLLAILRIPTAYFKSVLRCHIIENHGTKPTVSLVIALTVAASVLLILLCAALASILGVVALLIILLLLLLLILRHKLTAVRLAGLESGSARLE